MAQLKLMGIKMEAVIVGDESGKKYSEYAETSSTYILLQDMITEAVNYLVEEEGYGIENVFAPIGYDPDTTRAVTIAKDRNIFTAKTLLVTFNIEFVTPRHILDDALSNWKR